MAPTCEFDRLFQRRVVHILEMIFFSLDYKTFKNSLEVSKSWKALLTSEYLQKRGKDVYSGEIKKELLISAKEGNVHKIKLFKLFVVRIDLYYFGLLFLILFSKLNPQTQGGNVFCN